MEHRHLPPSDYPLIFSLQEQVEELEDRLKELKNGVQLQQRKNQELEELRTSLHRELSIYKCVWVPSLWGRGAGRRKGMGGMGPRWGSQSCGTAQAFPPGPQWGITAGIPAPLPNSKEGFAGNSCKGGEWLPKKQVWPFKWWFPQKCVEMS